MKIARRLFLRAATLLWSLAGAAHAGPSKREPRRPVLSAADARILRRYVDVLIPADHTPSGSALSVDVRLREVAAGQRDYRILLDHGLAWLQAQAMARFGRGFAQLAATQCEVIVEHMAGADHDTLERMYFERTRADAFYHYYGKSESWQGIRNYVGPPQPKGYMDHVQPPRNRV